MTTIMQPFQCDLPPQLQETHRTTHTGTTTRCKTIGGTIRDRNDPSRTRRTDEVPFIAGCSHFTRKNTRFRAPASSPQHIPCNIHAAITLRLAASRSKPAPIYGRGNTKWQQSCSHSNAICHHSFKKRIELRTQEQPLVAKHIGGTIRDRNIQKRPQPHQGFVLRLPPHKHSPCNIHAAITLRFAASGSKPAPIYGRGKTKWQQSCSHSNAICHHSFKKRIELRTQEQPLVANHIGGTIRDRNDPSRTRRTDEVPFIAGCSHFTRKNTRFRAPASSPQHSPCNIHAAITLRFAASRSKPAPIYGRGNTKWQQPCSHSNAICHHSFKKRIELRTQEQPLVAKHRRNNSRQKHTETTPAAPAAQTKYLWSPAADDPSRTRRTDEVPFAGCSHFRRKNTRFRAPQHSPCNIHAAITLRFAASRSKPAPIYGRGNTKWQQSCSHSNAICHHSFKKRIELRTQEQPLVANHIGGTIRDRNDPSRTRRTDEVPFIAGCSHSTRKNTRFRAPASSPQHSPCNIMHHSPSWLPVPFLTPPLHHHFPSSPLPFLTTSLRHHSPSSSLPFFTTSLRHHFPSSPLPFVTTSLPHHFPSSPLPFFTTSLPHHFPSSPLPFLTTSLPHHFPSSPLPFLTTSLPHHFPSSPPCVIASFSFVMYCNIMHHSPSWLPVPFLTNPLHHHFPSSPLPFLTTSLRHHSPSSSLPFIITSLRHHFPSSSLPFLTTSLPHHSPSPLPFLTTPLPHHFPSSPLPFLTTSLLHHFPSSPLPFVTTPLHHHFPSSPLPFLTTSLPHHFPSSPLPFIITSLHHHFPSSPLPFLTTSLPHHSPSSSLPFFTTSLPFFTTSLLHHFPSSPLPFFTTSLPHHFPSSTFPFLTTSLRHHSPSSSLPFSPLPFVTTPLHHRFPSSPTLCHSFLFFCYVLLHYVLLCDLPPFIKVNCIASYSFVICC